MKDITVFVSGLFKNYPAVKVVCIALGVMLTLLFALKLGEGIGRMIYNIWG